MTRREKPIERMRYAPGAVRFSEIEALESLQKLGQPAPAIRHRLLVEAA